MPRRSVACGCGVRIGGGSRTNPSNYPTRRTPRKCIPTGFMRSDPRPSLFVSRPPNSPRVSGLSTFLSRRFVNYVIVHLKGCTTCTVTEFDLPSLVGKGQRDGLARQRRRAGRRHCLGARKGTHPQPLPEKS